MGNDCAAGGAVGQQQAAVQLLQATVRAGHQPADRPDPRSDRDEPEQLHRAASPICSTSTPSIRRCGWRSPSRCSSFDDMARLRDIERHTGGKFRSYELDITYPLAWGREGVEAKLASLCAESGRRHHAAATTSSSSPTAASIASRSPSRRCWRCRPSTTTWCARACAPRAGLVVETGSAREVHHFAVLAGYGAEAVHPYLAMETLASTAPGPGRRSDGRQGDRQLHQGDRQGPVARSCPRWACRTYMSYCGAQLFEAVGLEQGCVDKYFRGTASQVGGIGVFEVAEEAIRMHRAAFGNDPVLAAHARCRRRIRLARARRRAHVDARRHRQAAAQRTRQRRSTPTRNTRRSSTTRAGAT